MSKIMPANLARTKSKKTNSGSLTEIQLRETQRTYRNRRETILPPSNCPYPRAGPMEAPMAGSNFTNQSVSQRVSGQDSTVTSQPKSTNQSVYERRNKL